MVNSIKFKGTYEVELDVRNRLRLNNESISLKDISIVRYKLDTYGEKEISFIKETMNKFKRSTHLAEVMLNDGIAEELKRLQDTFDNLALFIYVPIEDTDIGRGCLSEQKALNLISIEDMYFDRIILLDKSTTLHTESANGLKAEVSSLTGCTESDIGICGSPLSVEDNCCLTALRARELMSNYGAVEGVTIPSSNSQNTGCCGCIGHLDITENIHLNNRALKRTTTPKNKRNKKAKGIRIWV